MYYPKNKIITNQYTNGDELQYVDSKLSYKGYYWKTFENKIYTGKNPEDKPTLELESSYSSERPELISDPFANVVNIDLGYKGTSVFGNVGIRPYNLKNIKESNDQPHNDGIIEDYLRLKNISINDLPVKDYPSIYYPKPTEEDYTNESLIRYFVTKINSSTYIEVNKETYDKMVNKDNSIMYELFIPFFIVWTLSKDKDKMSTTNKNIVLLQEKKLKRTGLGQYLKYDFSKFHKE
jgi:hypothetical protein